MAYKIVKMWRNLLGNMVGGDRYEYRRHGNIVLHRYNTIYFFIPKVACSSLKVAISTLLEMSFEGENERHRTPHRRQYPFVPKDEIATSYTHYFKFCFVRNPWDRMVSCYRNKIHQDPEYSDKWFRDGVAENFWQYGDLFRGGMSFPDFVAAVAGIPDDRADEHIRSQHRFFTDRRGVSLVDYFGHFERLEDDFKSICQRIGASKEIVLPHLLKSTRQHYHAYYDDRTRRLVARRYEKDLELLGYEF